MEIEIKYSEPSKSFKREAVYAQIQFKKLLKNKNAKLTNVIGSYVPLLIVSIIALIFAFLMWLLTNIIAFILCGIPLLIIIIFCLLILFSCKHIEKTLFKIKSNVTLVFDETGITYKAESLHEFKIVWENLYLIRSFNEVTVFYSKDGMFAFLIPNEYDSKIMEALKTYSKESLFVK